MFSQKRIGLVIHSEISNDSLFLYIGIATIKFDRRIYKVFRRNAVTDKRTVIIRLKNFLQCGKVFFIENKPFEVIPFPANGWEVCVISMSLW